MSTTAQAMSAEEAADATSFLPESARDLGRRYGSTGTVHQGVEITRKWDKFREIEKWVDEADKMLLHSVVYDAWHQRLAQVTAAKFLVRAAKSDNPKAKIYADFVRRAYGLEGEPGMMVRPFEAIFRQLCSAHYYGFAVAEDLYYYRDGYVWLRDLESRSQRSIVGWGDTPGVLGPITQRVEAGVQPEPMPGDRVIVATRDQTDTDWQGRGLARSALAPWQRLTFAEDARITGVEQGVYRPPKVETSMEAVGASADPSLRQIADDMSDAVGDYTVGKNASVFRKVTDGNGRVLVDVDWVNNEGFDPKNCIASEERDAKLIRTSFGLAWMEMGQDGNSGSRALGQVHEGLTRMHAIADVEEIIGVLNGPPRPGGGLVGRLIHYNFEDVDNSLLPVIWHDGLEVDKLLELLPHLASLVGANVLTSRNALEEAILRGVDVAPLDDTEKRTVAERLPMGTGPGAEMLAAAAAVRRSVQNYRARETEQGVRL